MWKPLIAVFVVALVATVAVTNLDYFFPTDAYSQPSCGSTVAGTEPSCCQLVTTPPACCATSCCESEEIVCTPCQDSTGIIAGSLTTKLETK